MMLSLLAIILIEFTTVFIAGQPTAVINTTTGLVQGKILTTVWHSVQYASFQGIKYAEPPIGYLRFKPPMPIAPWSDVLDGTLAGPECMQIDNLIGAIRGSEDCLHLNVFTPVTNLVNITVQLKSVMVWIYGGTWVTGSSSTQSYGPDYLIERDVVIVTFNYRLGALGFLNLNHPNATGNAGLKDQNLALKWVQANIEKFGGNPNNVTIFGQSAGAASVGFHTLSEASAGLFHAAISMSGTPLVPWGFQTPEKSIQRAEHLGTLIGIHSTDKEVLLAAFYNASAEELVNATNKDGLIVSFTPTIENATIATDIFLSECSIEKYYSEKFNRVPQLLGFMEQETLRELSDVKSLIKGVNETIETIGDYEKNLTGLLKDVVNSLTNDLRYVELDVIEAAINITTDIEFISPIDGTQKILAHHNDNNPIYYYHMTFYTNRSLHNIRKDSTPILGAAHMDDIPYLFYLPWVNYTLNPNDPITHTIYRITTMWSNFAKYGNPTPHWVDEYPLNITWPNSGPEGLNLDIGYELTVGPRPTNFIVKGLQLLDNVIYPSANGCV